jgi:hypothetical protein
MDLFKKINALSLSPAAPVVIEEDGAVTSTASISSVAFPLIASVIKRTTNPIRIKKIPIVQYSNSGVGNLSLHRKVIESFDTNPSETDSTGLIAKLRGVSNRERVDDRDTVTFGITDEKDNIIKVTVSADQSEAFERELQSLLTDETTAVDIGELLFSLKDRYHIIGVDGNVEEEEEEDPTTMSSEQQDQQPPAEGEMDMGGEGDPGVMPPAEDTSSVASLMTQVIDMMKADADARKAEAQAKEAEAKTRQADSAKSNAMARVKQEEQLLDMEAHNKQQKEMDKETKRLAQLAKWKHDLPASKENERPAMAPNFGFVPGPENDEYQQTTQQEVPSEENEERTNKISVTPKLSLQQAVRAAMDRKPDASDIAKFISNRTGHS